MRATKAPVKSSSDKEISQRFGDWLIKEGLINQRKLRDALCHQRSSGGRLGEVLTQLNILSSKEITNALGKFLSIDTIHLEDVSQIDRNVARRIPESIAKRFCLVGISESGNEVVVAMSDPLNVVAIDTVSLKLKRQIKPVVAAEEEVKKTIEAIYHGSDIAEQQMRDIVELEVERDGTGLDDDIADIGSQDEAEAAPVIRFVDLMLSQAIKSRTSDIHIEPQERSMMVRMRIDGILTETVPPARKMQSAVITRIKILSNMDIAERRLPQDGRFKIKASGHAVDVRVSAIPTIYGEKIVMRILDASSLNNDLDMLGFEPERLKEFKGILSQPHGIIIVTGPTGSGKSTTLYSALNYLKDPTKNITTVEDPVEYRLAGINQIQTKADIDLTFASCLRSILRQDPDIILLGEIRDKETIDIAMKASLTGHLVLTTFHTNDAPGAISRMVFMGVEPYLLSSTLNLVLAQRLVRRICDRCKEKTKLDAEAMKCLNISQEDAAKATFYRGKGCKSCGSTGYKGRLPIFEFLIMDKELREMLVKGSTELEIRAAVRNKGYGGLLESGVSNMFKGFTTAEEVLRVTYTEDR